MNDDLHTAMRVHINNLKTVSTGMEAVKAECNFKNISELIGITLKVTLIGEKC